MLALAALVLPANLPAQEYLEAGDTVTVGESDIGKAKVPQYAFEEFDWVDICKNPMYAIVKKDGKCGIYDMMLHENVTEIEYEAIGYVRSTDAVDSIPCDLFRAKKGIKLGILCVCENDNSIISIWIDDPDEVHQLEGCTTVDKELTQKATEMLERCIEEQQMENVQVAVLDATTGRLKTWVRRDKDMEKEEAGKLLMHSCTSSLLKPFYTIMAMEERDLSLDSIYEGITYRQAIRNVNNEVMHQAMKKGFQKRVERRMWREMTDTAHPYVCPLVVAAGFSSIVNDGRVIIPTMCGDSVEIENETFPHSQIVNLKEVLRVDRKEMPQLTWLTTDTEWLGYATTEEIYTKDGKAATVIGKQIHFAGIFPVENPRYTICIVGEKYSEDATPALFKDVVNPLTKLLLKKE
jgi:hypothetical protein